MTMRRERFGWLVAGLVLAACNGDATGTDGGSDASNAADTGGTTDAGADTGTAADAATDGPTDGATASVINGCTAERYVDMSTGSDSDRMIMMNASHQFDMPCMTIAAGQSVMFMWTLSTYPIAPGAAPSRTGDPAGSSPNPIQMHSTGSVYTVAFPAAGLYPFYVPGQDANGLMGVIQVQ